MKECRASLPGQCTPGRSAAQSGKTLGMVEYQFLVIVDTVSEAKRLTIRKTLRYSGIPIIGDR
jgi:hypothetical protein